MSFPLGPSLEELLREKAKDDKKAIRAYEMAEAGYFYFEIVNALNIQPWYYVKWYIDRGRDLQS